jgi:RND family efflux transporter MFP subunit
LAVATLGSAQAALEQATSSLTEAQNQLDHTTLTAEYDSVITATSAEVGQVVPAGQTVVTLARPDIREAVFDVPDSVVSKARMDGAFSIWLLADPSVRTNGKVREMDPASDPATRTRRIRLTLPDPPSAFRLGSTIEISINEPTQPQVVVPAVALFDESGASAVWIADPKAGKVRRVSVKPVERFGDSVVVAGGLVAGERVVTAGVHSLADGQSVKVEESP